MSAADDFSCKRAEQINGREGETATLFGRCVVNLGGRGGGFAPRHLSRSAAGEVFSGREMIQQ